MLAVLGIVIVGHMYSQGRAYVGHNIVVASLLCVRYKIRA
jgi:hypothetical protein